MSDPAGAPRADMKIVLVTPEIPGNTGTIGRTCVALDLELILIRPYGFDLSEKSVRRAGLDYWKHVRLSEYDDWAGFLADRAPGATSFSSSRMTGAAARSTTRSTRRMPTWSSVARRRGSNSRSWPEWRTACFACRCGRRISVRSTSRTLRRPSSTRRCAPISPEFSENSPLSRRQPAAQPPRSGGSVGSGRSPAAHRTGVTGT